MKLSVRKKVANGLVLCLIVPRAAHTAVELYDTYSEGLNNFGAQDEFDLNQPGKSFAQTKLNADPGADPSADPSGYDPSAYDPSGYDPSGGDPSGCDPSGGRPTFAISAPRQLLTAEDGTSDLIELTITPGPKSAKTYNIVSTDPTEAQPVPDVVTIEADGCIPRPVWIVGQNDYKFDGDQDYAIEVYEKKKLVASIPGRNYDNDTFKEVAVDVLGPNSLALEEEGMFLVRAANISRMDPLPGTLVIEASPGLTIEDFAYVLYSGENLDSKPEASDSALAFQDVGIPFQDVLIVSLKVKMAELSPENQTISAQFIDVQTGHQTDDDQSVRSSR